MPTLSAIGNADKLQRALASLSLIHADLNNLATVHPVVMEARERLRALIADLQAAIDKYLRYAICEQSSLLAIFGCALGTNHP
jgi:hypothetical protein